MSSKNTLSELEKEEDKIRKTLESIRNFKLYGLNSSNNVIISMLSRYCYEMGRLLATNNLLNGLSDECYYWVQNQLERDKMNNDGQRKNLIREHDELQCKLKEIEQKLQELN